MLVQVLVSMQMVCRLIYVVGYIWRCGLWHFVFAHEVLGCLLISVKVQAVDVFAVSAASPVNRWNTVRDIAKMWGVPVPAAEALYCLNRPVLEVVFVLIYHLLVYLNGVCTQFTFCNLIKQDMPGAVRIGRVTLQKNDDAVSLRQLLIMLDLCVDA